MPAVAHADITACCVCNRVRMGGPEDFRSQPDILAAQGESISHTYCPECAQQAFSISRDDYIAKSNFARRSPAEELAALIIKCRHIAHEIHKGQKRVGGEPYINHVERVAAKVPDRLKPLALLHDTKEMSDLTLDHYRALGIPEHVVEGLDAISRRPDETYAEFIQRTRKNPDALAVKIVDIDDNDNDKDQPNPSMHKRYQKAREVLGAQSEVKL